MKKVCLTLPLAGLFVLLTTHVGAATITENFSTNPLQDGWRIFGDTNLFQWDSTNHNLAVTWDSSQSNSYFYHPLGTILTRDDDFTIAFDLQLNDVETTGYGFEIAVGFLNFGQAAQTHFSRGTGTNSPNLAEFDYFPAPDDGTISPTMISSNVQFASAFDFPLNLTNGVFYHIEMTYTASNQTLSTAIIYNNCRPFGPIDDVNLNAYGTGFSDFRLDTVAISSYNGAGDPYDSTFATGVITNLIVTVPPPPIQNLTASFSNAIWQTQFLSRSNWIYALERTADFQSWTNILPVTTGNATNLFLQDANPPAGKAFYRISAQRP
ncbi:MAG: hypothetical protein ABSD77_07275 [Verrucomicrobiota bacterium]|jgi:hypothetical protein